MDARGQKMAEVLVNYCVETKPKDWVVIRTGTLGEPMAAACVEAALNAGANPTVLLTSEDSQEVILRAASDEQLAFIPPAMRIMIEQADALIQILAPQNTRTMASAEPSKMAKQNKAFEPIMETYLKRSADGDLMWTAAQYPTHAAAQDAGMSLRAYEDFVYGAGLIDEPDPIQAWKELGKRQEHLVEWLKNKSLVHIKGPGTDLKVGISGRIWLNDDGHKNFPGGEIFTGPVEDVTEGTIAFTYPAYLQGREVTGVRLTFEKGRVVDFDAVGDREYLEQMLNMDEGARVLGEFAFGSNQGIQQFSKNTLFDEKIGGTLHMALGRAYPETGGKNESALHWDMVYNLRDGAEVTVDGQLFSKNGEFCI